jgi:hypothetical protein
LSWDFWYRNREFPPVFLLAGAGIIALLYGLYFRAGLDIEPAAGRFLHVILFTIFVPMATIYASLLAGEPKQRFTLPATAWSLVGWPYLNGVMAVAVSYLLLAFFANGVFQAGWPLLKPIAIACCIFVISHAISWALAVGEKWHFLVSMLLSVVCSVAVFWAYEGTVFESKAPLWESFYALEVAVLLLLTSGGYLLAVASFSLARQGRAIALADIALAAFERLDFRRGTTRTYASGCDAQAWMEWTRKGYCTAVGAGLTAFAVCIWFATGYLNELDTVAVIGVFTVMGVFATPFVGMFLGHQGERFNINEFVAVRPLADAKLADLILVNIAKSQLLGWIVWWLGMGLAIGCAFLSGTAPTTPHDYFALPVPPETWGQATLYFVGMAAGILLLCWTLASLGATAVLVRPWLMITLLVTGIVVPVSIPIIFPLPTPAIVVWLLQASIISTIVGGTLFAFVAAYRLKLIGMTRVLCSAVLCALLVAGAMLFLRFDPDSSLIYRTMQLSNCALPFTALAAAPLAIWWNRHQ